MVRQYEFVGKHLKRMEGREDLNVSLWKLAFQRSGEAIKERIARCKDHDRAVGSGVFLEYVSQWHCDINPFSAFRQSVCHDFMMARTA